MGKRKLELGDLVCRRELITNTALGVIIPDPDIEGLWAVFWFDAGGCGSSYYPEEIEKIAILAEERLGV